jgi:hypothetical protein
MVEGWTNRIFTAEHGTCVDMLRLLCRQDNDLGLGHGC